MARAECFKKSLSLAIKVLLLPSLIKFKINLSLQHNRAQAQNRPSMSPRSKEEAGEDSRGSQAARWRESPLWNGLRKATQPPAHLIPTAKAKRKRQNSVLGPRAQKTVQVGRGRGRMAASPAWPSSCHCCHSLQPPPLRGSQVFSCHSLAAALLCFEA